jgi:ATP-dependent RNA/DNA helicase IGHMBP2
MSATIQAFRNRIEQLIKAINCERKQEEDFFERYNAQRTIQERVNAGILWYPIQINRKSFTIGEYLEVEIERTKNIDKPHKIAVGTSAQLFHQDKDIESCRVIISRVRHNRIWLMVHQDMAEVIDDYDRGIAGLELIYDDKPYATMEKALRIVLSTDKAHLIDIIHQVQGNTDYKVRPWEIMPSADLGIRNDLNDSQKKAITSCLSSPHIGVIHGPPGTGKTTTLVALVQELSRHEKRILVCAPSNNAVDLLAERISAKGLSVLRIGNIARISDDLMHLTIEEQVHDHPEWQHIKKVKIRAQEIDKKASQYKRSFGHEERQLRNELRREARDMRKWAIELEDRLIHDIASQTKVIVTTLIGASNRLISNLSFDTLIIDEVSQSLEPECWNAILLAKRVILAGDHMQLPPTVKSPEADKLGLSRTLLDHTIPNAEYGGLLDTQYRMHDAILAFSNQKFYGGLLKSGLDVGTRTLRDDNEPLLYLDTVGCSFDESIDETSRSYHNKGEFFIIREHILLHRERLLGAKIGIISPYAAQVRYISDQISEDTDLRAIDIEVNSIDGFQGQEKQIIYISLVRSNEAADIGFLKDERRLNVALTRAQNKLIVIGDSGTIGSHPLYADLIDHITATGQYDSAWTYMG